LTAAFRTAMSRFMKDSKQMANKRMQGTRLRRAPDTRRYVRFKGIQ